MTNFLHNSGREWPAGQRADGWLVSNLLRRATRPASTVCKSGLSFFGSPRGRSCPAPQLSQERSLVLLPLPAPVTWARTATTLLMAHPPFHALVEKLSSCR